METFYRSIPEFIVKTDDITKLSNRACDNLKLGDEVILLDGDEQTKYNITSKSVDGMKLANITGEAVVEVIYSKEGNVWSYVETKTTELGGGTSFKMGYYIYNEETEKFEWIEDVPEDYSGIAYSFDSDGLYIDSYDNSELTNSIFVRPGGVEVSEGSENASLSKDGVNKLDFASLTHSFNELDPTLKQIVDDAIADDWTDGVSCTQAQWNAIKSLLDNSLYLNYGGYSMIKEMTNGITAFIFGAITTNVGNMLEIVYDDANSLLFAKNYEV